MGSSLGTVKLGRLSSLVKLIRASGGAEVIREISMWSTGLSLACSLMLFCIWDAVNEKLRRMTEFDTLDSCQLLTTNDEPRIGVEHPSYHETFVPHETPPSETKCATA